MTRFWADYTAYLVAQPPGVTEATSALSHVAVERGGGGQQHWDHSLIATLAAPRGHHHGLHRERRMRNDKQTGILSPLSSPPRRTPFLSAYFAHATNTFAEMALALSVMDLPFSAPAHTFGLLPEYTHSALHRVTCAMGISSDLPRKWWCCAAGVGVECLFGLFFCLVSCLVLRVRFASRRFSRRSFSFP